MADQLEGIDFALAAFRDDGDWQVAELAHEVLGDMESLTEALRRLPGETGALAMIAVDEDFFILVRVEDGVARVLLSDATAAEDWDLASSAVEFLHWPEPEEDEEPAPAGDLDLLGDLGLGAPELADLLDDEELYPDEVLSDIAGRLGFGDQFDAAVDLVAG